MHKINYRFTNILIKKEQQNFNEQLCYGRYISRPAYSLRVGETKKRNISADSCNESKESTGLTFDKRKDYTHRNDKPWRRNISL